MEQELHSPDGRFAVELNSQEMRMSHWVDQPFLLDRQTGDRLFEAPSLWSADSVVWSDDGEQVVMSMRLYPGRKPPVEVVLFPLLGKGKIVGYERVSKKEKTALGTSTRVHYELGERLVEGSFAELERYLAAY